MSSSARRSSFRSGPVVVAAVVAAACTPPAVRSGASGVASLVRERSGWSPDWTAPDTGGAHVTIPAGALDPDSAVRIALLRNPRVRFTLADIGLAAADLWRASVVRNPILDLSNGYPSQRGAGVFTGGVGFALLDALQLPLRRRVAQAEFLAAEQRVADAILGVTTATQRAYTAVQHAQQMLELRRTVASAAAASAAAADALRAAGNVPVLTHVREDAAAAQGAADVHEAEGDLATARAELGRLLGAGVADTAWAITALLPPPPEGDFALATLDSMALARRLDVAAARDAARAAAEALGLASRFRLLPDGTLGAFYEREPDGRFLGPTVGLPLPLFDRGGAAVLRAQSLLRQRVALHDALVVDTHADVAAWLARLRTQHARAQQLRSMVLPLRRQAVEETQKHVNAMDLSVFALIQARQAEIDAGRSYLDALRDYWFAHTELERATGGRLPAPPPR